MNGEFRFTEAFLDMAFLALWQSEAKTENDKERIRCVLEACEAEGISVRKYINILNAVITKWEEKGLNNVED